MVFGHEAWSTEAGEGPLVPAAFFASELLFWLLQAKYWRGRRLADQEALKTGMVGENLERRCSVCVLSSVWGGSFGALHHALRVLTQLQSTFLTRKPTHDVQRGRA